MPKKKPVKTKFSPVNLKKVYSYLINIGLKLNDKTRFRIKNKWWYCFITFLNIFLLYFFNNLSRDQVPFLTKNFIYCLPTLNYYLISLVLANLTFLVYKKRLWYEFIQVLLKTIAIAFWFVVYKVFPFNFEKVSNNQIIRLILIVIILITFWQLLSFVIANLYNLHLIRVKKEKFVVYK